MINTETDVENLFNTINRYPKSDWRKIRCRQVGTLANKYISR